MPTPILSVVNLSKAFSGRPILSGVDITLAPGTCLALVGHNGSGKSTLLACLAGELIADAGTVEIDGKNLALAPMHARTQIRYLRQEPESVVGLTGREYASFYAEVFSDPAAIAEITALADLGPSLDLLLSTYSVGMKRRLVMACLFAGDGKLFLLDEPFAGLDTDSRLRFREALRLRILRGASAVIAAHEQDLADLQIIGAQIVDAASLGARP